MTAHMDWLPTAPADFRMRCNAAAGDVAGLRALAACALNANQLRSLGAALDRLPVEARGGLTPFRLGLLSNTTTDFVVPAIRATGLRYGLDLAVEVGAFNQILHEATSPDSAINRDRCDAVLIAVDHHFMPERGFGESPAAEVADLLAMARDGLLEASGAPVIFSTIPAPPEAMFGSYDALLDGSRRAGAAASNAAIRDLVRASSGDLVFDVAALANAVGLIAWHDPVQWNLAKLPFGIDMIPLYAEHLVRLVAAIRGKSRKCLVLDLDNTCWGGVIGDDGLAGIVLGQGGAMGEAFLEVQRTALALRDRGVILAVCSKNDDAVARTPFIKHPEMLLREEHIAAFTANWTDKATNLEAIASELNIGLDALVFLDDNPAERAQVRQALPQVAAPELPEDPSLYARTLLAGGYFEAVAFSNDDRQRAAQYQANQARETIKKSSRDLGSYLESLQMVATFRPFDAIARARVTQLINKSNQYNLTTRRYTEAEVQALEADPGAVTMQVRLQDCFGDNGIVSVIVAHRQDDALDIDTWLMSCRVLGRELEYAVLNRIAEEARRHGAARITGRFIASGRNDMVRDHYGKLGFSPIGEADAAEWSLDLDGFTPRAVHMKTAVIEPEPA